MSGQNDIINLKVEKAIAIMDEVDMHVSNHYYITAINRLYYSCYHATKALLLTKELLSKTHTGVITLLNQHFVVTGLFNESQASFFSKLMHERIEDDYGDFLIFDFDDIKDFIEPGKSYLQYTINLIRQLQ